MMSDKQNENANPRRESLIRARRRISRGKPKAVSVGVFVLDDSRPSEKSVNNYFEEIAREMDPRSLAIVQKAREDILKSASTD
jgi:hypothetical protein